MKEIGLISVIVPVYNSAEFLEKCLESLVNQSYKNIEIILVNDGSKDNSLEIINQFANKDSRVVVIDQQNMGATQARKRGVQESKGEWIIFCDADDELPYNSVELLAENSTDSQIVIGQVSFTGSFKWPYKPCNAFLTKKQALKRIVNGKIHCGPVARLFSKSLFDESCFSVSSDIIQGEDRLMNLYLFSNLGKGKKVKQIEDVVYLYIQRPTFHPSDYSNRKKRIKLEMKILSKTSSTLVILAWLVYIKNELKLLIKRMLRKK